LKDFSARPRGDHSIAAGVAAGVANYFRKEKNRSATSGWTRTVT